MIKRKFSEAVHRRFTNASKLARGGRFDEAEDIVRELLIEEPEYASGWWLLGTLPTYKRTMGRAVPDDSVEVQAQSFRKAVEYEPDNATFQECLGMHLIHMGEFQESRTPLERAYQLESSTIEESISELESRIRQVPDNPRYLYGLAYLYTLMGNTDMADMFRERAYRSNINVDLFLAKQYDEAERVSQEILESEPESSGAWLILGNVQCVKELWTEAETSFRKALEIEQEYPHAWLGLATALLHQERFEEAEEADRKAKMFEWNIK
ncbi:MAG: tetratricopeptide repeat protein [Candidatus Thorarchaeota archaeon]